MNLNKPRNCGNSRQIGGANTLPEYVGPFAVNNSRRISLIPSESEQARFKPREQFKARISRRIPEQIRERLAGGGLRLVKGTA